ncbi:CheR family methyltransferase [Terriglobus tenax]|uniref:CheR family methyltransferase n=1 Tax=Terriglobus tenax TaxID=1111115 RepID=UPI0021E0E0ED|nr:protein-glutamate O-methyltransferase CheR [Terriglobus tenax]
MPTSDHNVLHGSSEFKCEPLLPLLKELTGITIPPQKIAMVAGRLRKRLTELGHPDCAEYISMIRRNSEEQQNFINLLTTNETSFFRTQRVWTYFCDVYLPEFRTSYPTNTLSAWSAAASTGEEAYSIAICCNEHLRNNPEFRYHILATDVDTEVLNRAKNGVFGSRTVDKLKASNPDLAERYFLLHEGDGYQANGDLLRHIRFTTHNLMHRPRLLGPHHIVFLRNVLIYFRPQEQTTILQNVASTMGPGTILILGESESIAALDVPFVFVAPQIYRRTL